MKKVCHSVLSLSVLFFLAFLLSALPVTGYAEEPEGTWIGFLGVDFTIIHFEPENSRLVMIDTLDNNYTEYFGTYRAENEQIIYERNDGETDSMTFDLSDNNMRLDSEWFGEREYIRIDDSYFPDDPDASPYIGENRTYMIQRAEDGGIRIFDYLGDAETVEIPAEVFGIPVTEIAPDAVCYQEGMKHLVLPDGLRLIGERAFEENHELESVRLPASLESIGSGVFSYCYNLKEIILPKDLQVLGDYAFWQCSFLRRAVLPEGLKALTTENFYGAERITFYVKPGSYAELFCKENDYAYIAPADEDWDRIFRDGEIPAELLPEIYDPELFGTWVEIYDGDVHFFRFSPTGELTELSSNGFYPETRSGSWEVYGDKIIMTFSDDGYSYEEEAPYRFEDGKLHMELYYERVMTAIDDSLYPEDLDACPYIGYDKEYAIGQLEDGSIVISGYMGTAETLAVPDTVFGFPVTAIGDTAFMSIDGLRTVVVPEGITSLGTQAFDNCHELESIKLPESLTVIGYSAFSSCSSLKEINIPAGVKTIEGYTFFSCPSLERIVIPAGVEQIDWPNFNSDSIVLVVEEGSYAEQYCKEEGHICVTPDGKQLNSPFEDDSGWYGDIPNEEGGEEPYEESYGDEALYNEAMELYNDEKYCSAREKFLQSGYGDWEEMAEKCIRPWPSSGELWHDPAQWLQDMELTIVTEQPSGTAMLVRIYKDGKPVSYVFISGSDSVTVKLPGNGYYEIKDGIGYDWYGIKEAFGRDGRYETMSFDEEGTKKVYLQSYYQYTLSINVTAPTPGGDDVYSESEDYENFTVD